MMVVLFSKCSMMKKFNHITITSAPGAGVTCGRGHVVVVTAETAQRGTAEKNGSKNPGGIYRG